MKSIGREEVIFSFRPGLPAVAEVDPGERFQVAVRDGFNENITSEDDTLDDLDWDRLAPATGPIAVSGAEAGDTLKVEVHGIELDDRGSMVTIPGAGCFGDELEEASTRIVPIENGRAVFRDDIELRLNPMIGVMGTMPSDVEIDTGNPGPHGGNMDVKKLGEGSTLYLPVFEEGGKLALGDMHAVMGDGEVSICGVEIGGRVTMAVYLIKDRQRSWPVLETDEHWYIVASHEELPEAVDLALGSLYDFMEQKTPLDRGEIVSLMSIAGEVEICQLVNPRSTVRAGISKKSLKSFDIRF